MPHAQARGIAARDQTENRPCGLRWRARARRKCAVIVTRAALAPAAVRILDGAQPFSGAQHVSLAIAFSGRRQAAQGEACSVDIRNPPTAIPASVGLLCANQELDSALRGVVGAVEAMRG